MSSARVDLTGLPFSSQVEEIYDRKFRLFFDMVPVSMQYAKLLCDPDAESEADKMIANASVFYLGA